MKTLFKISLMIYVCCFLGCAGERTVKPGNFLVSTLNPPITIKIDETLQEQEKIINTYLPGGPVSQIRETVFPFIKTEGNRITSAVLISFSEITDQTSYWTSEGNGTPDYLNSTKFVKFYGRYRSPAAERLLYSRGYDTTPNYVRVLWKRKCNNTTMLLVNYIELLPKNLDDYHWDTGDTSDYTWIPPKLSQEQDKFLKEFIKRGRQAITVIN